MGFWEEQETNWNRAMEGAREVDPIGYYPSYKTVVVSGTASMTAFAIVAVGILVAIKRKIR